MWNNWLLLPMDYCNQSLCIIILALYYCHLFMEYYYINPFDKSNLYLSCVCLYVYDTSLSDCSFENTLLVFFFCPQVCDSFKKSLRMYSEMVTQSGYLWFGFDNSNLCFQKEKEKMSFKMLRHSLITKRVLNLS